MIPRIPLSALFLVVQVLAARPPPETCDAGSIQDCLASFETKFAECDSDDLRCQCNSIITSGANCYASCPQEAMTTFIKTYNDGRCATFDPYLSKRQVEDSNDNASGDDAEAAANHAEEERVFREWLGIANDEDKRHADEDSEAKGSTSSNINDGYGSKKTNSTTSVKTTPTSTSTKTKRETGEPTDVEFAITVTANDPTTTISLSPQEYQSRLEKSRYKENLRSIRSERARIASEAEARLAQPTKIDKTTTSAARPSTSWNTQTLALKAEESVKASSGATMAKAGLALVISAGALAAFL